MKHIRDYVGRDLVWDQPHAFKEHYDLKSGDELIATLKFRNSFGSLATGESADGRWTFKRVGFFTTHVTVRFEGADTDLAVFRNNTWTGGGTLELPDGREWLAATNFWQTRYDITAPTDTPLLTFRRVSGLFHLSAAVDIHDAATELPELPWLVALGWYLNVLMQRDAAMMAT